MPTRTRCRISPKLVPLAACIVGIVCIVGAACEAPNRAPPPYTAPLADASARPATHWAFVAPQRSQLPEVSQSDWPRTPIDHFILHKVEAAGLQPAEVAPPHVLLRRVTLDLTGLPPTPDAIAAFEADPSDAAYEEQVEQLLNSPAFGEQRARYWLDVARYADTHGYHFDNYRSIWPYRDYVIAAFTAGKPFDVFTVEQLAGDLLPKPSSEQRTATGFIRCGMTTNETGVSEDEYAAIYARDQVETTAAAWLGLTVGCAACHDHKYDPITQQDFYALTAFFRNTKQAVLDDNAEDTPPSLQLPMSATKTLVVEEQSGAAFANVLTRGRYDAPREKVSARVPKSLPQLAAGEPNNRLGLAHWLTSAEQPLTARVAVNRFWSEVFGTGLVRTSNDFGRIGDAPSHPELLDWLAVEFRESGWDVKHLFKLMVTSAAYRQTAEVSADKLELDADNRLLSRGPRFRMDAEMVRDLALASSDLLVRDVGGPSVKPYQPDNLWEVVSLPESNTSEYQQDSGAALYRRSLYTFWKRQAPPPALEAFNAPSREASVVQRERTNTPLQALAALNDPQLIEAARVLATHALLAESSSAGRFDYIGRRVLSRAPSAAELATLQELLAAQRDLFDADEAAAQALVSVGASPVSEELGASELAAWTIIANTFLNLDEALTK
jgi:hypothetical protein